MKNLKVLNKAIEGNTEEQLFLCSKQKFEDGQVWPTKEDIEEEIIDEHANLKNYLNATGLQFFSSKPSYNKIYL